MLTFEQLQAEMEKDSKLDRTNLQEEIFKCISLFSKWLKYHYDYKSAAISGESKLADMVVQKQLFYSGAADSSVYKGHPMAHISAKNSTEMGRLIDGDTELCALRERADRNEAMRDIANNMVESLKYRPNYIKTILDIRTFESGA